MIYIVDEDVIQLRPYAMELKILGYEVKQIDNADAAFDILCQASDVELVLVDIMLATGDSKTSRYDRESTDDFLKTGLLLLDDLYKHNQTLFPSKLAIFSMGSQNWLVTKIKEASSKYKIPYLRKRDYPSPYQFGQKIHDLLNNKNS